MIGSERISAFLKSSSNASPSALSALRVAELLDAQLGVRLLRGGGGGERGVDALLGDVVVAGELEGDERGAAVLGDLALVALGERATRRRGRAAAASSRATTSSTRGLERRVVGLAVALAGLDEDLLVGLCREVGVGDRLVGDAATRRCPCPRRRASWCRPRRRGRRRRRRRRASRRWRSCGAGRSSGRRGRRGSCWALCLPSGRWGVTEASCRARGRARHSVRPGVLRCAVPPPRVRGGCLRGLL